MSGFTFGVLTPRQFRVLMYAVRCRAEGVYAESGWDGNHRYPREIFVELEALGLIRKWMGRWVPLCGWP